AATLPTDLRVRGGKTRYILKKALAGMLPEETLHRKKRGFGAPFGAWLTRELSGVTDRLLGQEAVRRRGLLNPEVVDGIVADHRASRADHTDHLVALITLELWCCMYLDGESRESVTNRLEEAAPEGR